MGPPYLVPGEKHLHALGEEERGQEVALLAAPERHDGRVFGRPLHPAVPAQVVIVAVPVALAVGLVVLLVVADEVPEGEAVVAGDEVDAGARPAAAPLVEVAASGEAVSQVSYLTPSSPLQKRRTVSRYFPFHSTQRTGKFPT